MPQELVVIRNIILVIILNFISYRTILGQSENTIPELINGQSIREILKLKCIQRENCLGIGVYKFRVANYGRVDSIIYSGNLGKYADSLQVIEFKKLNFKPFMKQDKEVWFQVKVYSTYVTHESSKYLTGLENTIDFLYKQEISDYFPDSERPNFTYLIRDNIILLPPLRLEIVQ
jgi:hypothetical protein